MTGRDCESQREFLLHILYYQRSIYKYSNLYLHNVSKLIHTDAVVFYIRVFWLLKRCRLASRSSPRCYPIVSCVKLPHWRPGFGMGLPLKILEVENSSVIQSSNIYYISNIFFFINPKNTLHPIILHRPRSTICQVSKVETHFGHEPCRSLQSGSGLHDYLLNGRVPVAF